MATSIRVGIVGAGTNTREKHIPGLRAIEGVEIVGVANRTRESSERAAGELGVPRAYDDWLEVIDDDDVDAVVIGTWPYMHYPVTVAALDAGKHVLCEARMAMNADEARLMLEASRSRPDLVAQVVPAPHTLVVDGVIRERIAEGYLGDLLAVELRISEGTFVDRLGPLHWRQNRDLSGINSLALGIWYEAMMRWVGPASRVMARTRTFAPWRRTEGAALAVATVPDHIDVLADLACGAVANMRLTTVAGLVERRDCLLLGSEGTLHWDGVGETLWGGRRGDERLQEVPIPPEKRGRWRVEAEWVNAIRGIEPVRLTRFEDGVRYMEFTEAVIRSGQTGLIVELPLLT